MDSVTSLDVIHRILELTGSKGFDPLTCNLGGYRAIQAAPRTHLKMICCDY